MNMTRLNPFWRQLPVYSPVTFGSLWAGLAGALGWGDPLAELRELLLNEYGSDDVLLVDSGTSALRLAIEASIAETGTDIVALPAYCCFDVATAAVGGGARVAIYDVLPETLGPDFDSMRNALEAGARTIVVVHLYGVPVDMARSRELATEFKAILIEDAAQGAGGSWNGRPLGSSGDLGILSFGRGKGRTGGGGGGLLANESRGSSIIGGIREVSRASRRGFSEVARLALQWAFGRPALYGIPASIPFLGLGETRYEDPWEPTGMASGPAAALLANWEASRREEALRRDYGADLRRAGFQFDESARDPAIQPGFLRQPVLMGTAEWDTCARLTAVDGLGSGYPLPLGDLEPLKPLISTVQQTKARLVTANIRTIPTHRYQRS